MQKAMSIKEFMNGSNQEITDKEIQQYQALSIGVKAAVIVLMGLLPFHVNEVLELMNGGLNEAVEAYINQFTPSQFLDVLKESK